MESLSTERVAASVGLPSRYTIFVEAALRFINESGWETAEKAAVAESIDKETASNFGAVAFKFSKKEFNIMSVGFGPPGVEPDEQ